MHYSMRTLLLAATAAAIVCACLVYPDPIMGDLVYTSGLLLIAFGAIAAIYSNGQRRAFLIGFLILFGGYYFVGLSQYEMRMAMAYMQQAGNMRYTVPSTGLLTSRFLAFAYESLHSPSEGLVSGLRPSRSLAPDKLVGGYVAFMMVGHAVFAFALGIIGGRVAQRLWGRAMPLIGRPLEEVLKELSEE
jgi:hypothetical protein